MRVRFLLALCLLVASVVSNAHEVRPAYLSIREVDANVYEVIWKVPGRGENLKLALDVQFPADVSPLLPTRAQFINDAYIEHRRLASASGLTGKTVRIDGLDNTMTETLLRYEARDGTVQTSRLTPTSPSVVIEGRPSMVEVAVTYLWLGVEHILFGFDHLLFVLALILIVPNRRLLVLTITAFTVAHSLTLALAALGFVHVPGRPVEATIALSILLLATEVMRVRGGQVTLTSRWPWAVAFTFGLLHGFGFASALAETGLPQSDIPLALFSFNVGVELGQLAFIGVVLAVISVARRFSSGRPVHRYALPVTTYLIGTSAAYWFIDRLTVLGS